MKMRGGGGRGGLLRLYIANPSIYIHQILSFLQLNDLENIVIKSNFDFIIHRSIHICMYIPSRPRTYLPYMHDIRNCCCVFGIKSNLMDIYRVYSSSTIQVI